MQKMHSMSFLRQIFKFECAENNSKLFLSMTVIPARWEDGRLTQYLLVSQNIGEKHKMADLANTDMLTELYNKRYFETIMNMRVQRGKAFALIFMDLDFSSRSTIHMATRQEMRSFAM